MRILRVLLVVLALAFCAYSLVDQWDATVRAFEQMSVPTLLGSFAAGLAGLVGWMLSWRVFLAGLGSPLPLKAMYRINSISQLGKYVPGKVWALVTQMELAKEYDVPRPRSFGSTLLAMAASQGTGLAVAAVTLPLTSETARQRYWWLFLLAPLMLACLHPKVVTWAVNLLLKLARRDPLERPVRLGEMLLGSFLAVVGWAFFGVHLWLLCAAVGGDGPGLIFLATGAYALAFVAGFLVFIAPGGIGARETAMVLVLTPVLPAGAPIVVALASRVLLTIADLANAGLAVLIGGRPPKPDSGERSAEAPAEGNEPEPGTLVTGTQLSETKE